MLHSLIRLMMDLGEKAHKYYFNSHNIQGYTLSANIIINVNSNHLLEGGGCISSTVKPLSSPFILLSLKVSLYAV